jgi:hypothetical protein
MYIYEILTWRTLFAVDRSVTLFARAAPSHPDRAAALRLEHDPAEVVLALKEKQDQCLYYKTLYGRNKLDCLPLPFTSTQD